MKKQLFLLLTLFSIGSLHAMDDQNENSASSSLHAMNDQNENSAPSSLLAMLQEEPTLNTGEQSIEDILATALLFTPQVAQPSGSATSPTTPRSRRAERVYKKMTKAGSNKGLLGAFARISTSAVFKNDAATNAVQRAQFATSATDREKYLRIAASSSQKNSNARLKSVFEFLELAHRERNMKYAQFLFAIRKLNKPVSQRALNYANATEPTDYEKLWINNISYIGNMDTSRTALYKLLNDRRDPFTAVLKERIILIKNTVRTAKKAATKNKLTENDRLFCQLQDQELQELEQTLKILLITEDSQFTPEQRCNLSLMCSFDYNRISPLMKKLQKNQALIQKYGAKAKELSIQYNKTPFSNIRTEYENAYKLFKSATTRNNLIIKGIQYSFFIQDTIRLAKNRIHPLMKVLTALQSDRTNAPVEKQATLDAQIATTTAKLNTLRNSIKAEIKVRERYIEKIIVLLTPVSVEKLNAFIAILNPMLKDERQHRKLLIRKTKLKENLEIIAESEKAKLQENLATTNTALGVLKAKITQAHSKLSEL